MSIAFRSKEEVGYASRTSLPVPVPTGAKAGDVLLCDVFLEPNGVATAMAGWTLVGARVDNTAEGGWSHSIFVKVYEGEAGPYTVTWDGVSRPGFAAIIAYSGVSHSAPVNAQSGQAHAVAAGNVTAPSVTTTVANTLLVMYAMVDGFWSGSPPTGFTSRMFSGGVSDDTKAAAGASGEIAALYTGSSVSSIGALVALAPELVPTVTKPSKHETAKGVSVELQIEAEHAEAYKATGLPAGLSINETTGKITGSPTTIEEPTVEVKVVNLVGEATTSFVWKITEATAPMTIVSAEKPPLGLHAELVFPDGTTKRWDSESREPGDRPSGITFRSQRYTGFADGSVTLGRRIDIDYPDLRLLEGVNLIGYDGSVAYEGQITSLPRTLETSPQAGVQLMGWMGHAKRKPFVEVYIDRDLSKWVSASTRRVVSLLSNNYTPGNSSQLIDEAGEPAIELSFPGPWVSPFRPIADSWWLPQPGITLGALFYKLAKYNGQTMISTDKGWSATVLLADDDLPSAYDLSANLYPGPTAALLSATVATRRAACVQLIYTGTPAGTSGQTYSVFMTELAVYGNHGLTRRVAEGANEPGGFYVSDMMANIASRFAPKLDTSGIQDTTFIVPQASFLTDTFPYDAWQTLNAYHLWEMDVFEKRRLNYYPINLTDWDWEVRLSDPGTTVSLQGDDLTTLANGVIVRYTDLATGYETRLTPDEYPELKDTSPNNPANENGEQLYTPLSLSVPTTKEGAIQIGRAYLAEFNQPKAPGTITVKGHIRDRAGHWRPGWMVRSSDRLIISDMPNDRVRVVHEASWDHETKTVKIAVDSTIKELDAILARFGIALEAANLNLPTP